MGADRVPYCPTNCPGVEECRVTIKNANVSATADCLVASIVAAIRIGGFKVTVLALENEGAKCVFGDQYLKEREEKWVAGTETGATAEGPATAKGLVETEAVVKIGAVAEGELT